MNGEGWPSYSGETGPGASPEPPEAGLGRGSGSPCASGWES